MLTSVWAWQQRGSSFQRTRALAHAYSVKEETLCVSDLTSLMVSHYKASLGSVSLTLDLPSPCIRGGEVGPGPTCTFKRGTELRSVTASPRGKSNFRLDTSGTVWCGHNRRLAALPATAYLRSVHWRSREPVLASWRGTGEIALLTLTQTLCSSWQLALL